MITDFNDINHLKEIGFSGFKTKAELFQDSSMIPTHKGVYLILNSDKGNPTYLEKGTGGFFKKKDPNVSIEELRMNWVELCGAMKYFDCNKAIIATNGGILNDALEVANKLDIEILNLNFTFKEETKSSSSKSFENIWSNYIIPLTGKELIREDGSKNKILKIDWSQVHRLTSNGKENKINIEIFKEAYSVLLREGSISRDYINQNYLGRASSGVILILAQLPFVELKKNPIRLTLIEDETYYLLKSPTNAKRLLGSIENYEKSLSNKTPPLL